MKTYFAGPEPTICEELACQMSTYLTQKGFVEGFELQVCRDIVGQMYEWNDFDEIIDEGCINIDTGIPEVLTKVQKRHRFGYFLETLVMWEVPVRVAFDLLVSLKPTVFVGWSADFFHRD
jgi:hypothetical protein